MNAFDGVITILGIILGSALLGGADPRHIVAAGVGALIAMGISGASGTYMAESAEQERKIKELEEAMLIKLEGSVIVDARRKAALISALVDAGSAVVAGFLVLTPYFAAAFRLLSEQTAFYASLAMSLGLLFVLGAFLGKVAKNNIVVSGVKALAIGVATLLLITLLNLMF
ncbi:MAG: VIT1/CCC1 transporter family protein [Thaumarchaeota archaeon]|nr:VIT1/CCC1 transporter family protein [Nitrososphaerota archaeon]